jgi:outer membrane lipoprotein-sorting protein
MAFSRPSSSPPDKLAPLDIALKKQATFHALHVRFRQTKKIPALNAPIKTTGELWLRPGKAFRWQLGKPAASTAIYDGHQVYLLDEKQKTAAAYPPDDRRVKPMLLMLGIGEGASTQTMIQIFRVTGVNRHKEHYIVAFKPKSGKLKRVLKSMVIQINLKNSFMERIEWVQKDGSIVTTEFFPPKINPTLPNGIFNFNHQHYRWK